MNEQGPGHNFYHKMTSPDSSKLKLSEDKLRVICFICKGSQETHLEEDHRDRLDQMELNLLKTSQETRNYTNYQVKSKSVFIIPPEPNMSMRRESHK